MGVFVYEFKKNIYIECVKKVEGDRAPKNKDDKTQLSEPGPAIQDSTVWQSSLAGAHVGFGMRPSDGSHSEGRHGRATAIL